MKNNLNNEKPTNIKEFKKWLKLTLGYEINEKYKFYYNTVCKQLKADFKESNFWNNITTEFQEINDRYLIKNGVDLLIPSNIPEIDIKSLDSLIIKAYRINVLNNENFPLPPKDGWITPENWFESVNDIIRTTIVVKYLDGVQFLIDELENLAQLHKLNFTSSFEAREEGYYAAHSGVKVPLSIPDANFSPTEKLINIEIQITTQIQEIIKTLLHKQYEKDRKNLVPKDYKWQWDHKSPKFASNYLGHITHYVEGMIVEIRNKEK